MPGSVNLQYQSVNAVFVVYVVLVFHCYFCTFDVVSSFVFGVRKHMQSQLKSFAFVISPHTPPPSSSSCSFASDDAVDTNELMTPVSPALQLSLGPHKQAVPVPILSVR